MFSFFNEFGAAQRLAAKKFNVIFFAESRHYFQYFRHLFEELIAVPHIRIAYITADKADDVLHDKRVEGYYLKTTLAGLFPRLQADVMIMTMPDLQNFVFKRSPSVKKYVYVFHALVSTHQQYRAHAFDHYDVLFCTGPQQAEEIRESEKIYSLRAKELVQYGYPLLQELKSKAAQTTVQMKKILIAPSWYKEGILNTCIIPLVEELQKGANEIWVRPHPEFVKRNRKAYEKLVRKMQEDGNVHFDHSPSVYTHLPDAAHLVTDRSGIGLEYAFATGRPVLFIDTPLKVQNADASKFSLEPLENRYRKELGISLQPAALYKISDVTQALERRREEFRTSIEKAENEVLFPPDCWLNGLHWIEKNLLQG